MVSPHDARSPLRRWPCSCSRRLASPRRVDSCGRAWRAPKVGRPTLRRSCLRAAADIRAYWTARHVGRLRADRISSRLVSCSARVARLVKRRAMTLHEAVRAPLHSIRRVHDFGRQDHAGGWHVLRTAARNAQSTDRHSRWLRRELSERRARGRHARQRGLSRRHALVAGLAAGVYAGAEFGPGIPLRASASRR